MAVGLAAVMPLPHFPLTRAGPENSGFRFGRHVFCEGLVWQDVAVRARGEPVLAWKIPETLKPPNTARSQFFPPPKLPSPNGRPHTRVTTTRCGWLVTDTVRSI